VGILLSAAHIVRILNTPSGLPIYNSHCDRVSRGFSIKQLKFNKQGKLTLSRVNRQMTQDEQEMFVNPGVR